MISLACWVVTLVLFILPCYSDQGLIRLTLGLRDEDGKYYVALTNTDYGYLQMKVGEEWKTVNAEGFGTEELAVACHQLGFPLDSPNHMETVTLAPGLYQQEEFVDNVDCDADAQKLQDCTYDFESRLGGRDALEVTCGVTVTDPLTSGILTKITSGTCASAGCQISKRTECGNSSGYCDHSECLDDVCPSGCYSYNFRGNMVMKWNSQCGDGNGECTAEVPCYCDCNKYTLVTDAKSCEDAGMETITTLSQCAEAVSSLNLADNIDRGDIKVSQMDHDRKDGCIWHAQGKEATLFFDSTIMNEPCNYLGYAGCLCARSATSSSTDSIYPVYFHLNITFQESAGSNGAEAFETHKDKITEVLSEFLKMEYKTDINAIFINDTHLSAEVKYEISSKSERQVAKEIDDDWFEIKFPLKLISKEVNVLNVDTIKTSWRRDFYKLESSSTLLGGFLVSFSLLFIFL